MTNQQTYRIAVGMSGGVDSTATAYILQQQGHEVFGVTMYLFDVKDSDGRLIQPAFISDAKKMCELLKIDHKIIDLREPFKRLIQNTFKTDYLKGITPNPCVKCNKVIKYGLLVEAAMALGADKIATGHYARVVYDEGADRYRLLTGKTERKDQAYFLHQLTQNVLSKLILPLGQFETKEEVRKVASVFSDYISEKKDSQGICFVDQSDFSQTLSADLPENYGHGNLVNTDGEVLGHHTGYYQFTIGQKKGLNLEGQKKATVLRIDAEQSEVIVGEDEDCYASKLSASEVNWISGEPLLNDLFAQVKICQWGYWLQAKVSPNDDRGTVIVEFEAPVRAIAPGQYCVFYQGEEVLGGGLIDFVYS